MKLSNNDVRASMGLHPHKHSYKLNGVLHAVDEFGMYRIYAFKCKHCGSNVGFNRERFRKALLNKLR